MLINTVLVTGLPPLALLPGLLAGWPLPSPCCCAQWQHGPGAVVRTRPPANTLCQQRVSCSSLTSYHSYILPSLIIVTLFGVAALKHRQALVHLHSLAAQPVLHHSHGNSATSATKQLHLSPLYSWWDIHLAQHAFKAIRGFHHLHQQSLFTQRSC